MAVKNFQTNRDDIQVNLPRKKRGDNQIKKHMKYYLTGLAGAGKTYYGKLWAKEFDFDFYDLDELIENKTKSSIKKIFSEKGEEFFRDLEEEVLKNTGSIQNAIIACGGGTPCFHNNMQWMNDNGTTIWLKQDINTISRNLVNSTVVRPLLQNKTGAEAGNILQNLLKTRKDFYSRAKFTIDLSREHSHTIQNIFTSHA